MTENDWPSTELVGPMLQQVKRVLRLPPAVLGRKFRLTACTLIRNVIDWDADEKLRELVEAVEVFCDRGGSFAEVAALYPPPVSSLRVVGYRHDDLKGALVGHDSFASAHNAAAQTGGYLSAARVRRTTHGQAVLVRDIFGNPFRPVAFDPSWRSESAVALARTAYDTRDFTLLPILADALEEAGCDHADVLTHCRDPNGVHVRGCWVVDGVLGKQ